MASLASLIALCISSGTQDETGREAPSRLVTGIPSSRGYNVSAKSRAARSLTGQAVQTKFDTPRAKNDSAKLGASPGARWLARSGVTPDSHAFEKTNFGMRSIRPSVRAEQLAAGEQPALTCRIVLVVDAVPGVM